eukprot:CAMPEP_0174922446 /NCGR_PEP_ID=MMETSP1355-20121228/5879_1 /TAXON_ID=464990 /ORGANISM="Hemiselmis tepida, Strain CCMP443" /LENGTH=43 /DNA_ID= /DNA_START= /DNA_END= /DNA_ORIENTATION=
MRDEGPAGFFTGVGSRVGKTGPSMAISLAVYEGLKVLWASHAP